ncbi:hypothetical protein KIN20_006090 [Parelaphostrongylus tenuis]|uniref:Chromo shadow domain-containing protein n=1 Tax=Parelaphostrongylus tenuis TaxID=148309 RepID=A0AAD5M1B9_PARTN|nr:hypothetical protein KIN20_006090 [Parelaphostrongylus tenuis]
MDAEQEITASYDIPNHFRIVDESTKQNNENNSRDDIGAVKAMIYKRKNKTGKPVYKVTWKVEKKKTPVTSSESREEQLHRIIRYTNAPGELHYLVKWNDDSVDLIPAKEANIK